MRSTLILAFTILSLALVACSGVEIQHSATDKFSAGDYRYYKWRTEPLPSTTRSNDPVYAIDPVLRREVDADLQSKGYVLDKARAQFTVDYLYVSGMQQGEPSQLASNVTPYPRVTPNRQVNQATVDNAIALGGVKETNNIILQFNDLASNQEVWQASLTKVVEDANNIDSSRLDKNLKDYLTRALKALPPAGQ
ncbi:Uncharacterised protein [Halioglobus japonicus]|nr:Uncharacterised protein [Halioglobus japonicus]